MLLKSEIQISEIDRDHVPIAFLIFILLSHFQISNPGSDSQTTAFMFLTTLTLTTILALESFNSHYSPQSLHSNSFVHFYLIRVIRVYLKNRKMSRPSA